MRSALKSTIAKIGKRGRKELLLPRAVEGDECAINKVDAMLEMAAPSESKCPLLKK
jgi:hypothetical protein